MAIVRDEQGHENQGGGGHGEKVPAGRDAGRFSADSIWPHDGACRGLYVDEVLAAEGARQNLAASYGKLMLGACKNMAPGTFWSGLIDEVRIYNRAVKVIGR